ncbi:MAG: PAS domain-containing protein, partial [Bacillota bacterium]
MAEQTFLSHKLERSYAEELLTILESTYNGIIAINKEGIVTIYNKSAERFLGKPASLVLGRHIKEILVNTG